MLIRRKKAQSTAEYAILLSLVIAAALGMQNEIRRSLQARYHDAEAFFVKSTPELGATAQWEPGYGVKTTTDQFSERSRNEVYDEEGGKEAWTTINEASDATYGSTRVE